MKKILSNICSGKNNVQWTLFAFTVFIIILAVVSSCDNIIQQAYIADSQNNVTPSPSPPPSLPVTNFVAIPGTDTIVLTWVNPVAADFDSVLLLRQTNGFPESHDDADADIIYEGNESTYTDTDVTEGTTYYYALYTKSGDNVYSSLSAKAMATLSDFPSEIRARCFYLIGGSSSYTDPFDNLITAIDAFDPETDTVYPNIATLPHSRYSCDIASALGKIYVFGGLDEDRNTIATVDVLDVMSPSWPNNIWSMGKEMPLPRYSLRAENIDDKIYVFGGSTNISIPWAAMTDNNHRYDPATNNWVTDESKVPKLTRKFMNFGSGAYGGTLIYGVGRYDAQPTFGRYLRLHNLSANNYSTELNDTVTMTNNIASNAGCFYHRLLSDNTDLLVYFIIGGCTDSGSYYEPLRQQLNGEELNAVASVYYLPMPATTLAILSLGALPTPIPPEEGTMDLNTARAYAEADFYGENLYVFCGLNDQSPVVSSSYEKIHVDDSLSFPSGWIEYNSVGLNNRYAFGLTKVYN